VQHSRTGAQTPCALAAGEAIAGGNAQIGAPAALEVPHRAHPIAPGQR